MAEAYTRTAIKETDKLLTTQFHYGGTWIQTLNGWLKVLPVSQLDDWLKVLRVSHLDGCLKVLSVSHLDDW